MQYIFRYEMAVYLCIVSLYNIDLHAAVSENIVISHFIERIALWISRSCFNKAALLLIAWSNSTLIFIQVSNKAMYLECEEKTVV